VNKQVEILRSCTAQVNLDQDLDHPMHGLYLGIFAYARACTQKQLTAVGSHAHGTQRRGSLVARRTGSQQLAHDVGNLCGLCRKSAAKLRKALDGVHADLAERFPVHGS